MASFARHVALAGVLLACVEARGQANIEDDFDSAALVPPWTSAPVGNSNRLDAGVPAAAHRGAGGLRVVDANSSSGSRAEALVTYDLGNPTGPYFLRFWMRVEASSNVSDQEVLAQFGSTTADPHSPSLFDVELNTQQSNITVGGSNATTLWIQDNADGGQVALVGAWHLYEAELGGVGTSSGTRRLWIDGVKQYEDLNIDYSGLSLTHIYAGAPWASNGTWTGTLDFDDLRSSTARPASRVGVAASGTAAPGQCTVIQLEMRDSTGAFAAAPYDAGLSLASDGGTFYTDAACAAASSSIFISAGASTRPAWFVPAGSGSVSLWATHLDFLSEAPAVLQVTPDGGSVGPDGGSGGPDGGFTASLVKVSGDDQTSSVAGPLPQPLRVQLLDGSGAPIPGAQVSFLCATDGGSVAPGTISTDGAGFAQASAALGPAARPYVFSASAAGAATVRFSAQAIPAGASRLTLSANPEVLGAGAQAALTASSQDAYGNLVTAFSQPVFFAVSSGPGGSFSASPVDAVSGVAGTVFTPSGVGPAVLTVSSVGMVGAQVTVFVTDGGDLDGGADDVARSAVACHCAAFPGGSWLLLVSASLLLFRRGAKRAGAARRS